MNIEDRIRGLTVDGKSISEIAALLGKSKSLISYYRKRIGLLDLSNRPIEELYDWTLINEFLKYKTPVETRKQFGLSKNTWTKAVKKGLVSKTISRMSDADVFCVNSLYTKTSRLYDWLIKNQANECSECGCGGYWNGMPLRLHVDHRNGVRDDNRYDNLRLLCPNCHSQTDTYAGRNIKNPDRVAKRWRCI